MNFPEKSRDNYPTGEIAPPPRGEPFWHLENRSRRCHNGPRTFHNTESEARFSRSSTKNGRRAPHFIRQAMVRWQRFFGKDGLNSRLAQAANVSTASQRPGRQPWPRGSQRSASSGRGYFIRRKAVVSFWTRSFAPLSQMARKHSVYVAPPSKM